MSAEILETHTLRIGRFQMELSSSALARLSNLPKDRRLLNIRVKANTLLQESVVQVLARCLDDDKLEVQPFIQALPHDEVVALWCLAAHLGEHTLTYALSQHILKTHVSTGGVGSG